VWRQFERAKAARESQLFVVVDCLVAQDDHGEFRHGGLHGLRQGW
jgi:hypothetical protein